MTNEVAAQVEEEAYIGEEISLSPEVIIKEQIRVGVN